MSGQSPYMSATPYGYPTNFQQRDTRYPGNATVETAMALNRRPSLLAGYHNHFNCPDRTSLTPYMFSLTPSVSMEPHVDGHSKRSRYPSSVPLLIDVKKEQPLYQPQTEAISPILDEPKVDSNMRDTAIIRNSISKLESDIEMTMKKLHRAKLSQSQMKSQADRSAAVEVENDDRDDLLRTNGSQTLIEKILHDNRKKAEDGHRVLSRLNSEMDLTIPLYQEPSDLESMEKIRIQYMNVMKNRLVNLFKKSRERYMCRTKFESDKYDQAYENWEKSIEKDEKCILAKDTSTYRETFEKTFPEIRKAREDKEKKQSTPNTTNESSTDQQQQQQQPPPQVLSTLSTIEPDNEGEDEYEKMRKSSVIPPIMFDSWKRKHHYFNQNNFIPGDAAVFYKEHSKLPYWSAEEKQIFIEKFTQSPKNFGYISSFLENKTTEQCVQFYYMTKKTENYKSLLRKQTQASRRRAKQNTTTMTTTTVTSSTTIETTLVTRVMASNTIVSSTSQQILGLGQDAERSVDRIDTDSDRRDINPGDTSEGKASNKNRCQLLSCTSDKGGKKRNRKSRLRRFPAEWNDLSKEQQEEIRRLLQIPSDVQRCCLRCYEKVANEVRHRQSTPINEEQGVDEDDDDDDTLPINRKCKPNDDEEWTESEIHAFTEVVEKFNHDWTQIAEHVHRSKESCRAFYLKNQRKTISPSDDHNIDEENGSISDSELGPSKAVSDDNALKNLNEDSNDSTHGMVIDENEEQSSIVDEKPADAIPPGTNLITIASLVEKEISKTLNDTEKCSVNNRSTSPERPMTNNNNNCIPPPPLVALNKSHSQYSSHPPQQFASKGSIMRGTPIPASAPTTKPIAVDIPASHPQPHHYNSPRNEYAHLKSPKILDRNFEQQHLLQQQQCAAYMRHHNHHQQHYMQQQQHKNSPHKIELPSTDTFETLRADFVTSKYLTTTHSPNHERPHHSPPQRSPSINQQLLPPPSAIAPPTSNPSVQSSHHSQQQTALLTQQFLAAQGVYPQDFIPSGLLPYPSYYSSLPSTSPFLIDPRLMHEYASAAAANNEQLKADHHKAAMRLSRQQHHYHHPPPPSVPTHSPPESSYPSQSAKRHSHDLGYPTNDYPSSIWRTQNMTNPQQQMHSQMKLNSSTNESSLVKFNDLSRHSATRVTESSSRSPDDYHNRVNPSRAAVESPSMHFQRVEAHTHHKSSHDKSNPNLHFSDHSTEGNPLNYLRQPANIHKSQPSHHSPHRHHHPHHPNSTNRSLGPPLQNSQISPHQSPYSLHTHHHSPIDTPPTQRQQLHYPPPQRISTHHSESIKNTKELISIQDFMNKNVNAFVGSTNNENKNSTNDSFPTNELTRSHQVTNSDQLILLDGDDDSNPNEQSDMLNRSNTDSQMPERRRDNSIKKILSNQPLDKQEYAEINQKVQNSIGGTSKIHSTNDQTILERSNSLSGRTRSRGSITMRMLMGASDIYADGKVQSPTTNEDQPNKRPASPTDKGAKLEYLIRDALDRECPPVAKRDESSQVFQNFPSNPAKRLRTLSRDDEQRSSTHEPRDPFALQPLSKGPHHQSTSASNTEKNWQTIIQQQQYHSTQFPSQTSRPSGSITQGSSVSPSSRSATDQQQYSSNANNQLLNSRYSRYNKSNEQQSSEDHSPRAKMTPRLNPPHSPVSEAQLESSSSSTSPPANTNTTPPLPGSPTTPTTSNSAHPLKKRLISGYELEQQRNSPVVPAAEEITNPANESEPVPQAEVPGESVVQATEETENLA